MPYGQITRTLVQTDAARVERLIERVRQLGYQEKHKKVLAYSKHELPGSEVVDKEIQDREQRANGQSELRLPLKRLDNEREAVKLREMEWVENFSTFYVGSGCLMYLFNKQTTYSGSEVNPYGLQQPHRDSDSRSK